MHPTAESDFAVCIIPRIQTPRCASHHTAESSDEQFSKNSAVCITSRSRAPRCASHCRAKLCGVQHTADCGVKVTNFLKKLRSVPTTAESSSAVCFLPRCQARRCASHRGVKLHTLESKSKSLGVSGCF